MQEEVGVEDQEKIEIGEQWIEEDTLEEENGRREESTVDRMHYECVTRRFPPRATGTSLHLGFLR